MAFVGSVVSATLKADSASHSSVGGVHLQGVVIHVDSVNQTLSLSQPFVDGIPSQDHSLTLMASDISDLHILRTAEETRNYAPLGTPPSPTAEEEVVDEAIVRRESLSAKQVQIIRKDSQVQDPVEMKRLQSGLESLGYQKAPIHEACVGAEGAESSPAPTQRRKKSPDETRDNGNGGRHRRTKGHHLVTHSYSAGSISDSELPQNNRRPARNGRRLNTPKKSDYYQGRRRDDDSCFSCDVDAIIGKEFDFERSNQMFDKEAVMEEITAEQRGYGGRNGDSRSQHSSHHSRHLDVPEAKYRHDENILGTPSPATYRQIKLRVDVEEECRTDSGLVVPCISSKLQTKILTAASKHGFSEERQMEAAGRSACEMLLQLLGGSQRLAPQNAHQTPSVVVLCGGEGELNSAGPIILSPPAVGLAIARQLSNHRVKVFVCVPQKLIDVFTKHGLLATELKLLKLTDAKILHSVNDLPATPTDVILSALDAPTQPHPGPTTDNWFAGVVQWANMNKAPILAIDPAGMAATYPPCDPLQAKWTLQFVLPLMTTKDVAVPFSATPTSTPQLYLCDLGIPRKVLREIGIQYQSPFGAKSFIALHRD